MPGGQLHRIEAAQAAADQRRPIQALNQFRHLMQRLLRRRIQIRQMHLRAAALRAYADHRLVHFAALLALPGVTFAQAKIKVAAIYTVPFEQQWVSRIHKALKAAEARGEIEYKASENVSNADYERVMREYATGGNQLILGEVFGVEAAARKVAKDFPKTSFLMGSSGKPQAPNFSVFDNYIQEPAYLTGLIAGLLLAAVVLLVVVLMPAVKNKREEAFVED